jgi:hypothetical protein
MSETHDILEQFATEVDASATWRFMGAAGDMSTGIFEADVISRGDIPTVTSEDFGDLRDAVTVETPPEDSPNRVHIIRFLGTLVELEDLRIYLSDKLVYPPEGEDPTDMLNGPGLLFAAILRKRSDPSVA